MAYDQSKHFLLQFGITGVPTPTHYATPGMGPTVATPISVTVPFNCLLTQMRVEQRVAPGGIVIDTYTVNDDAVATAAVATVSTTDTAGIAPYPPPCNARADGKYHPRPLS